MRRRNPIKLIAGLPGTPRLWVMLSIACLLVSGFFGVADYVFDGTGSGSSDPELDKSIAQFFQQFRSTTLTQVAVDLTSLGSGSVLCLFALMCYSAIVATRDRRGFVHLTLALFGSLVWPEFLKGLYERPRPEGVLHLVPVVTASFPSGHSFDAATCYATFAFFFARYVPRLRTEIYCYVLAATIVLIVGMTRIYLGVHYATDVMAGISAGAAWAFFLAAVFSVWYRQPGDASATPSAKAA